ncbi:hypothetical protein SOHN41_03766 [Shewanella sp. HN-41]|nr:hypothetical protein SOHN41_03766 [Shewanella sp. HN-41]
MIHHVNLNREFKTYAQKLRIILLILLRFLMLHWDTQYLFWLQHSKKFDIAALAITAALM